MRGGRFRRGWELTERSWSLLRSDPAPLRRAPRGVCGVALDRCAADGRATGGFSADQLQSAPGARR